MIDIHSHTLYSDGSSSVDELLMEAERIGLSILSITDHNTIEAYNELKDLSIRNKFNGEIIPGIEITTTYKGETIEILGYGFELDKMQYFLDSSVKTFEEIHIMEYELIKKRYREIGVIFDENNIKFNPKKGSCHFALITEIKKYPENNKFFLYEESITANSGYARDELCNPKSMLYVDVSSLYPSLEDTILMIHKSGGLAFLAHTYAYSSNISDELLNIIDNYELDGLECFHTIFTEEQTNYLVELCKDRNLYMSGGSDFHGSRKINHDLGIGNGNLLIDESVINDWIRKYLHEFNNVRSKKKDK